MLKHHADIAARGTQLRVIELREIAPRNDHLALGGPVEQVDHPHQRTLARAAAPDDAKHFARRDVQVDAAQGLDRALWARINLGDAP